MTAQPIPAYILEGYRREQARKLTGGAGREMSIWTPNPDRGDMPNTQRLAYESKADVIGLSGTAGWGKALSLDTPLPTPNGWITMGDVKIGDILFDDCGFPCEVTATSQVMYNHDVYEVRFSDGSIIKADADHKWLTFTYTERAALVQRTDEWRDKRRNKRPSVSTGARPNAAKPRHGRNSPVKSIPTGNVRTTFEILETLRTNDKKRAANHAVPVASPLQLPDIELPVSPYVFGAWLGDGSSYKAEITTADTQVLGEINKSYKTKQRGKYEHGIYGLLPELKGLGVIANKHIPVLYLRASESQRSELLMGLMDTDGTADLESGACEFYSTNKRLAYDVWELITSLGFKSSVVIGRATLNGIDCGEKYRIKFSTSRPVFRLTRKLERQIAKERGTQAWRYITDVKKVESEPVKCVAVNSVSHLYLAGHTMIPTHNTDLMLGMAANKHKHSVIFRRVFPNLRSIIERSRMIFGEGKGHAQDSFNESLHRWSLDNGARMLEFEACQMEKDKYKQRGRPRDFYGIDEAPEFTRTQVEFITGWNRSTDPKQHCQIVLAFNVPSDDAGGWVIDYFMPWIAYLFPVKFSHPNPAKPGELRWYATIDGKETECKDGTPFQHGSEMVHPRSRTFFFGTLADNPHYDETYLAVLQSMPEPERSRLLYGNFAVETSADANQVIPTAWVRLAQKRWMEMEKPNTPLSGVGVDLVRGGKDNFALSKRYGTWFDEIIKVPGVNVEDGPAAALLMYHALGEEKHIGYINMDVVGVGSSGYDSAKVIWPGLVHPISAGEHSDYVAMSKTDPPQPLFKMRNVRAEYYWRFREALDPEHGAGLALPPGNELVSDLCAARYKLLAGGIIQIEEKDAIKERIGRSPDVGEAVMMNWMQPLNKSTWQDVRDLGRLDDFISPFA